MQPIGKDWNKIQAQWTIAGVWVTGAIGVITLFFMWWLDQRAHNQPAGNPPVMPVAWWMPLLIVVAVVGSALLHYRAVVKTKQQQQPEGSKDKAEEHAVPVKPPSNKLVIHSALWGVGGSSYKDVAPDLRKHIKESVIDAIDVAIVNPNLGGDPYPHTHKHLEVTYAYGENGTPQKLVTKEYEQLVLPEIERHNSREPDPALAIKIIDVVPSYKKLNDNGEPLEYPLKYHVAMRNDDPAEPLDILIQDYIPMAVTLKKLVLGSLQIKFGSVMYPQGPTDRIGVFPGQQFQLWLGVDETLFDLDALKRLRMKIGTLVLRVNGKAVNFKL